MSKHKHAAPKPDHPWAVSTGEAAAFLARVTAPMIARSDLIAPWILDVGAGQGRVASALAGGGWRVRAIEPDPEAAALARARDPRVDVLELDAVADEGTSRAHALAVPGGYDAAYFGRSLHHVAELGRALSFARALLARGAPLVLDEFAWDRADRATAEWFFSRWDAGLAAGRLEARDSDENAAEFTDPLARWQAAFLHDPPLFRGDAMLAALRALPGTTVESVEICPGLYRFFEQRSTTVDEPWIRALLAEERAAIAAGSIRAVGLRAVARID